MTILYPVSEAISYADFTTGDFDSEKKEDEAVKTVWLKEKDGSYRMASADKNSRLWLTGARIIERNNSSQNG